MRVALVHDYLREYGGAERVLETLHEIFPDAPVYTAFVDKKSLGIHAARFQNWDIKESWASEIPWITKIYSPLRVLSDQFFGSFDLSSYDIVISSTNMYMAKGVITEGATKHLCYCHTPPRSLYGYTTMTDWKKNPVVRVVGELINHYMRVVDFKTSRNPTQFIANSKEVQKRIQKFYRRESVVIYPPIEVPVSLPKATKEDFVLCVGRLAASKHIDLVIKTCTTEHLPLKVVGSGPGLEYLKSLAGPSVEFLGGVDDATLKDLYARAKVLVYPAEDEDFGMVPVEAMAYGTPVIVHRSGGFLETVVENKTGLFLDHFTETELAKLLHEALKKKWNAESLHKHAKTFSKERFKKEMLALITQTAV